jgi:hypothetical protein
MTLYTFVGVLKKRDNEKNGTSIKYGKDDKEENGNEVIIIIIIHKHYKKFSSSLYLQTILYHQA